MADERENQGFTAEQLEQLRIDSALGGDIPLPLGAAAVIGRKGVSKIAETLEPQVVKAGVALKEMLAEIRSAYLERQAIKEAAEAAALKEMRANIEPLESIINRGIREGKIPHQSMENNKGADLFVKNIKELGDMVDRDQLRNYAKLAVEDEANYRSTLSSTAKFLRAFHYDNANPEVGYLIGPSRYGGTWMTHLKAAAADSDMQELGIMALNALRGGAQVIGISAAGVKTAIGKPLDNMDVQNAENQHTWQNISGDQDLRAALELKPEFSNAVQNVLGMMRDSYINLTQEEKAEFGGTIMTDESRYMDAAKRTVASEIITGKFDQQADKSRSAEQAAAGAGELDRQEHEVAVEPSIDR